MNTEKDKVKQLVARLKDMQKRTGEKFPEWMLDENRMGSGTITAAEQQEWAETVCRSMRGTVAMLYLIECGKRYGFREGKHVFRNGEITLVLSKELIENFLITYVEKNLLQHKPAERYIAVYQFYQANDQQPNESEQSWFTGFLDEIFTDLTSRLHTFESMPVQPLMH